MKKRIISGFMALLMCCTVLCPAAAAPAPYSSLYLDSYGAGMTAKGNGKMAVSYLVFGTDIMDKLGAQTILVEEWDGTGWYRYATYPVSKNPSFYADDVSEHAGTLYFYGTPGLAYRATVTAYAELDGKSDTGTVMSNEEICI